MLMEILNKKEIGLMVNFLKIKNSNNKVFNIYL